MQIKANAVIKKESNQHITIKKIIDPISGMKIKRAISAWAIKYNGNNYFNLGYSNDLNNWKSYAKFDIEGKICAIIIDKNSPNILKNSSTYYGGGFTGVLIGESTKWEKNWKDKKGNKYNEIVAIIEKEKLTDSIKILSYNDFNKKFGKTPANFQGKMKIQYFKKIRKNKCDK